MYITSRMLALVLTLSMAASSFAQIENPVYVDDSPQAWELFRQARDQTQHNAGEAVRIYQELLDEFGMRLIPVNETDTSQYRSVRQRVLAELTKDPALLDRYRIIQKQPAERMLAENDLERLALTRTLTEAGLEAMVRLAQRNLEAANFQAAATWLQQAQTHPDFSGRRAAHVNYMSAVVALHLQNDAEVQAAQQRLAQAGSEARPLLESLQARLQTHIDNIEVSASTLTQGNAEPAELAGLVAQPIWTFTMQDSLLRRRLAMAQDEPLNPQQQTLQNATMEGRIRESDFITVVPTAAGEMVYINEGHTIRALNRLTGRQEWAYSNLNRISATERDVQGSLDLSIITVGEGALVALTGHALPNGRSESGRVLCLDAETGSYRWSVSLGTLPGVPEGSNVEQLFPHGAAVIANQTVYVAARRVSTQAITSAYVVALDLQDGGKAKWVRYITSSGGMRPLRPFDNLMYQDGSLYISSAIGATARINAATGEILWLTRFSTPFNAGLAEQGRRPWEMTSPVVTPRGVLLIEPDYRRVTLLENETGAPLESHPATGATEWNSPRYLIANKTHVFAIGSEIRAFDLEHLQQTSWRFPTPVHAQSPVIGPSTVAAPVPSPPPSSMELQGRVHLANGAVLAPTNQGLLILDSNRGTIVNQLAVKTVGNPLAIDSQLLVASGDRLDSYMSFDRAEKMLRERLAQSPADAEPALSMLRLAMRVQNLTLALESADLATRAIIAGGGSANSVASRDELISLLLELASMNIETTPQEGEAIYAALNTAAIEHRHRVEYLLAYGEWLSKRDLHRSVETYQTILSNRELAGSLRVDAAAVLSAASWARQRLADLMVKHGPQVYASQADFAAMRLRQLGANAGPSELSALASEFPFADAGIDAALQAATTLAGRHEYRNAAAIVMNAYRAGTPSAAGQSKLLGKYASICVKAKWNDQLEALMRHAAIAHPKISLTTDEGTVTPADWLTTNAYLAGRRLPTIGALASADGQSVTGSVVQPVRTSTSQISSVAAVLGAHMQHTPADQSLVRAGNTLRLLKNSVNEPAWSTPLDEISSGASLLHFDQSNIVLWSASDQADPKAVLVNAADGARKWSANIREFLDGVQTREPFRGRRDQLPDGEPYDPNHIIPLANSNTLFCIQRNGGVVAIDLADGRSVRWSRRNNTNPLGLDQVHFVALHDSTLFIAGVQRPSGNSDVTPKIIALDTQSGATVLAEAESLRQFGRAGVKWMRLSPMGSLIFGTATGIHVVDAYSGERLWSNSSYGGLDSQRAWMMGESRMLVEDQRGRLRSVVMNTGHISEPFESPVRGEWDPQELRSMHIVGAKATALYPQRVVVYDGVTGAIVGADVVSDDRDYRWLIPAQNAADGTGRLIVVNGRSTQAMTGDGINSSRRTHWMYRLYVLSDNGRVIGDPLQLQPLTDRVQQISLMDGWLLLSMANDTIAISLNGP